MVEAPDKVICPYCGADCTGSAEDGSPHRCDTCHATEMGKYDELLEDASEEEARTGWWRGTYTLEETFR